MARQFIQIPWSKKLGLAYWGRNRSGSQCGIALYPAQGETPSVVLMPINSLALSTTAAQLEVPKSHIPTLIKALQELIA